MADLFYSNWFWVHIGLMYAGFAGFITAVASAAIYLFQSYQLKSKHPGAVFLKLPSLDVLDRIHFRALSLGVVLFSLGILSGFFWARDLKGLNEIFKDPKVILSFFTCFFYWLVFLVRLSAIRRGQKIAAGTVFAFLLLAVTFMSGHLAPAAIRGF